LIKGQIYVIGSLRNPLITELTIKLEQEGFNIFSEWFAASENADDSLRDYFKARGYSYKEALQSHAAKHIFSFDKYHLDQSAAAVLVMPAGKSCHLEAGYMVGCGKPVFYYMEEEPERWDIMVQFCSAVCIGYDDLVRELKNDYTPF
jgi:hypothetical protein